jgi:hypothetical protein
MLKNLLKDHDFSKLYYPRLDSQLENKSFIFIFFWYKRIFWGGGGGWVFIVFKLRICDRLTFDFNVINISENYIEPLIV